MTAKEKILTRAKRGDLMYAKINAIKVATVAITCKKGEAVAIGYSLYSSNMVPLCWEFPPQHLKDAEADAGYHDRIAEWAWEYVYKHLTIENNGKLICCFPPCSDNLMFKEELFIFKP